MGRKGAKMDIDHIMGHTASAMAIVGALVGWLPGICALVGAVWYGIQIYESKTVQDWLAKRRALKSTPKE